VAVPARAAPVPKCTIHSATEERKGPLAPFTADRSAPRGSLGSVAGDLQLPGGRRLTLALQPPGLPPRPVRPTRGAWPGARLQAARCDPRASAGAASRSSSGPFEVVARTQRIPGRSTKGSLDGTLREMSSPRHGRTGCISRRFDELGGSARPPSRSSPSRSASSSMPPIRGRGSDVRSEVPSDAPSSRERCFHEAPLDELPDGVFVLREANRGWC
jgi:hypothetical protein